MTKQNKNLEANELNDDVLESATGGYTTENGKLLVTEAEKIKIENAYPGKLNWETSSDGKSFSPILSGPGQKQRINQMIKCLKPSSHLGGGVRL